MSIYVPPKFHNFRQIYHPLLAHKLTQLRKISTPKKEFNELVREITQLLVYEATKDLPVAIIKIKNTIESMEAPSLEGKKPVILPILRAGLGMVDGFLTHIPSARVGHIGLYRNEETLQPEQYYFKIPRHSENRQFYICDPMLATGGSAAHTIQCLKKVGVTKITFVCLVAAPEGVKKLLDDHPDVPIFSASLDRQLNEHGYILPGLGDAGDRLFGTR